jgi:predicted DNA-binding transcriptional regulator YafY
MALRLERILKIDSLVRHQPGQTAKEIASILEVSERTIFYDLAYLRDRLGAPMTCSKNGYSYTDPHWQLPDTPLTQGELFALLLGKQILDQYCGNAFEKELKTAVDSLIQRLPQQTKTKIGELSQVYQFSSGAKVDIPPIVWSEVNRSILEQKQLHLKYAGIGTEEETIRTIDPYLVYNVRGSQYLIGYCHLRKDIRSFRLNRIREIQLKESSFRVKVDFDPKSYLRGTFQIEIVHSPLDVKILFYPEAAKYIRERIWHESQQLTEQEDGSLILKMTTVSLGEIKRWILTWGANAKVLSPTKLIAEIQQEVAAMKTLYDFTHKV